VNACKKTSHRATAAIQTWIAKQVWYCVIGYFGSNSLRNRNKQAGNTFLCA